MIIQAQDLIDFWHGLKNGSVHPRDQGSFDEQRFATTLHPVPWVGNLLNAKIYLLYVNPGLSGEEFECEKDPEFSKKIKSNLNGNDPYIYLLDKFSFHPGHKWARKIFGTDTTEQHASQICALQLVPYHSQKGDYARQISATLPSSILMQGFVKHSLLPKAHAGNIGLVVTRASKYWKINEESQNVLIYKFPENVGGYQTRKTRGGVLIRSILKY